jgi:ribosomal protein L11 methyltransferase
VYALDIDGAALENAKENILRNGASEKIKIRKGRIGTIRKKFDVIVANIDIRNLRRMKWPLIRHLQERGFLILSGILKEEIKNLRERYWETGVFQWLKETQQDEWACLILKKK